MPNEINMRHSWNAIAPHYQERSQIPTEFAHYGPHCPNENQLRLLGEVRDKRILEIGCGGGQCSIAFAKQGAVVTGIDLSDEQIAYARKLAAAEGVNATFLQGDVTDLRQIPDTSQDIVFSAYALSYIEQIDRCFAEVHRVLAPGGLFVFSVDHPFFNCLDQNELRVASSYHDTGADEWAWNYADLGIHAPMRSFMRKVSDWYNLLHAAGFEVLQISEPAPVESGSGQDWGGCYTYERQQMIPATIIWKARKS
jgi:ubiquinone/menaquinone biosynthesis C-methylase UbiE